MASTDLKNSPLGKQTAYPEHYNADLLCPIPRENLWIDRGYKIAPFTGVDIWNAYEISWLNDQGLPQIATGDFWIPCDSDFLIESKSFKLYLNSYNQTRVSNAADVEDRLQRDLTRCLGKDINFNLIQPTNQISQRYPLPGMCLDDQKISIEDYSLNPDLLSTASSPNHGSNAQKNPDPDLEIHETLHSNLLRSNCPITDQPDWASILIDYKGAAIDHASLLKYIVSYRRHQGFHEQCVENIFLDIMEHCKPSELTVYARYLRRGGLDINPYRSTSDSLPENQLLIRQ